MLYLISRYHTLNLLYMSILSSPKEQTPNEIQQFLHLMVSDMLHLWKDRIMVPMKSNPHGRFLFIISCNLVFDWLGHLVCVILMAVVCDKSAAHKMGGFASHSHNWFCTLCWISVHDKSRMIAFQERGESQLSRPWMLLQLSWSNYLI